MSDTEPTAQEEYQHLLRLQSSIEKQIEACRERIRQEFIDSCPSFKLPVDADLNWWGSLGGALSINYEGKVEVSTDEPSIIHGRNRKSYKAGTSFIVLKSWKTGKKTLGTHYLLLNKRTGGVTSFYG